MYTCISHSSSLDLKIYLENERKLLEENFNEVSLEVLKGKQKHLEEIRLQKLKGWKSET